MAQQLTKKVAEMARGLSAVIKHTKKQIRQASAERERQRRDHLQQACADVRAGRRSAAEAVKHYELVKKATLNKWLATGMHHKLPHETSRGRPPYLDAQVEAVLVGWLSAKAAIGQPVNSNVLILIATLCYRKMTGEQDLPGANHADWLRGFMTRYNDDFYIEKASSTTSVIKARRTPQALSKARKEGLNKQNISGYQDRCIQPFIDEHNVRWTDVANWDEWQLDLQATMQTGFVVTPSNGGQMYISVPKEKDEHMTVLCGSVGLWRAPALIVFKGKELDVNWLEHIQNCNGYIIVGVSDNGWITPELKVAWFRHVVTHPDFPNKDRPVMWFFDGHYTNFDYDLGVAMMTRLTDPGEVPEFGELYARVQLHKVAGISTTTTTTTSGEGGSGGSSSTTTTTTSSGEGGSSSTTTATTEAAAATRTTRTTPSTTASSSSSGGGGGSSCTTSTSTTTTTSSSSSSSSCTTTTTIASGSSTTASSSSSSSSSEPSEERRAALPPLPRGDYASVFPAHATHGVQPMDAKGGQIQTAKQNLSALVKQEYHAVGQLTKPAILYLFHLAYNGGTYKPHRDVTRKVDGVTSDVIARSYRAVGFYGNEHSKGPFNYNPCAAIDENKWIKDYETVAIAGAGKVCLGAFKPEPVAHVPAGRTRSSGITAAYTESDSFRRQRGSRGPATNLTLQACYEAAQRTVPHRLCTPHPRLRCGQAQPAGRGGGSCPARRSCGEEEGGGQGCGYRSCEGYGRGVPGNNI